MKFEHILIVILLIVLLFLALKPPTKPVTFVEGDDARLLGWGWPVTWNLDWDGGPGRDRHEILTRRGPYNAGGHMRERRHR